MERLSGVAGALFTHHEPAELIIQQLAEIARDRGIHVTVAESDTIKAMYGGHRTESDERAGHGETFFGGHGRSGEGSDMEEDHDGGCGLEFLQKVDENRGSGCRTASLIKENAHAGDRRDDSTAKSRCQSQAMGPIGSSLQPLTVRIIFGEGQEMRQRDPVRGLCSPLVFFPEAPEDEDTGESEGQDEGEPGPLWHFRERRREVHPVECAEDDESNGHDNDREPPDDDRDEGDHEGCDERHQDHADSVCLAKLGGLPQPRH